MQVKRRAPKTDQRQRLFQFTTPLAHPVRQADNSPEFIFVFRVS